MAIDVHTVSTNTAGSPGAYADRLVMGLFREQSMPASAASVTSLGSITAGSGFTRVDTLTAAPSGGTLTAGVVPADPASVVVTSLKAVSGTVVAPGTGVAISDTFNPIGGTLTASGVYGNGTNTAGAATLLTATHIKVVSATVVAAGTGGTPGAVTITGTTGTGTKWQGTAVISAGGNLTGPITITVAGDYTATPTLAGDAITGGSLSGATCSVVMGALTLVVTTAGDYTVRPPIPASLANVVGTGAGVTALGALAYGVSAAIVTHSGNYSGAPSFTITDSGPGTGASIATATLGGSGAAIVRKVVAGFPATYTASVTPNNQDCRTYTVRKSTTDVSVAFVGATTLVAGTFDLLTVA